MQNIHRMGSEERQKGVNEGLGKSDAAKESYSKDGFLLTKITNFCKKQIT